MRLFIFLICFFSFSAFAFAQEEACQPKTLSLNEAILLAVRENPNVQQAQMNQVQQKFALEVQRWQFQPHFQVQATTGINRTVTSGNQLTTHNTGIQPQMTYQSPIGTQMTVTANNNISNHYNPSLNVQIMQPLMRGFGRAIVEAALYNAIDSERISRLNVEGTLRTTVTSVINAYLDVVSAQHTVEIDEEALKRAKTSVEQTKLFIKAGRKAGVELVTVQADAAKAQAQLESDKNNLDQTRYALLTAIGIDPSTKVTFTNLNVPTLIKKYSTPTLEETKELTLENDIQFQVDRITLHGSTKRNLDSAVDNTRWQLNLTLNGVAGGGSGGGVNAGIDSLTNGNNNSQSAMLNLTIPIDDRNAKLAVTSAKIALREAEIALKQEKWSKETGAINGWNTIYSAERTLRFAEDAERLQEKTYKISYQKYTYGLIDSLELQSAQQRLIDSQNSLLAAKIGYLKALVALDLQIGRTLKTWDVQVKL